MNEIQLERLIIAVEGINNNLNCLVKTAEANKEKMEILETMLQDLKNNPFGIK